MIDIYVFEQLFVHASGLGPAFGQAGFFLRQVAGPQPLATQRFSSEADRTVKVLDSILADHEFVAGVSLENAPNVRRWYEKMEGRPAVQRAIERVNALASV